MECGNIQKIRDDKMKIRIAMPQAKPMMICFENLTPEIMPNTSMAGNCRIWWRGMVSENHSFMGKEISQDITRIVSMKIISLVFTGTN